MKNLILNYTMAAIQKNYPNYSDCKVKEIRYGLESIYLTITKILVILMISFIGNFLKETLMIMLFFNLIRFFAFGIHASKSWICWVVSIICFIIGPIICKYVVIDQKYLLILMTIFLICFTLYAPADTVKRPLINKNKRIRSKVCCMLIVIFLLYLCIVIRDSVLLNCIVMATLFGVISILPLTYHIFHLPYNNYKSYVIPKNT